MERRALAVAIIGIGAAGVLELVRRQAPRGSLVDNAQAVYEDAVNAVTGWQLPSRAAPYAAAIGDAEAANGIPAGLLARLLYQESRYREDIISGATVSSTGAQGIAQFMPATARELGVDPLDPYQAIAAAALYLRRLYNAAGSWAGALAAYNWGIGNVTRRGLAAAPQETRDYVAQITADVPAAA